MPTLPRFMPTCHARGAAAASFLAAVSSLAAPGAALQKDAAGPVSHLDPRSWEEWLLPLDSVGESPQPQASSCRLYVREVGDGPPVVLLHGGWGGDLEDLFYGLLPLADDARLIAYDQRGSLRSRCDALPTAADHVADLEALRRARGLERLTLVGHSMGTRLAMMYAQAHPDRVAGLALIAPTWPTPDAPAVEREGQPWDDPAVADELAEHGLVLPRRREDGAVGWSINHRIIFAAVNLGDVRLWRSTRPPWAYDVEVANATAESMPSIFDFRPALAALEVPVLVLQGSEDFLPGATWADAVPGARRVNVERAGHNAYTDAPELVLGELVRFLTAVAAR
jgi:proline iminopeptidase